MYYLGGWNIPQKKSMENRFGELFVWPWVVYSASSLWSPPLRYCSINFCTNLVRMCFIGGIRRDQILNHKILTASSYKYRNVNLEFGSGIKRRKCMAWTGFLTWNLDWGTCIFQKMWEEEEKDSKFPLRLPLFLPMLLCSLYLSLICLQINVLHCYFGPY